MSDDKDLASGDCSLPLCTCLLSYNLTWWTKESLGCLHIFNIFSIEIEVHHFFLPFPPSAPPY